MTFIARRFVIALIVGVILGTLMTAAGNAIMINYCQGIAGLIYVYH